jgi:anti-sigma factor RsiW
MTTNERLSEAMLSDLADGTLSGPEWDAWLVAHPADAAEVAAARQARLFVQQLRDLSVDVPADLEARVLSRVHRATALRELFNLNLSGSARVLLELLTIFFSFVPTASDQRQA